MITINPSPLVLRFVLVSQSEGFRRTAAQAPTGSEMPLI